MSSVKHYNLFNGLRDYLRHDTTILDNKDQLEQQDTQEPMEVLHLLESVNTQNGMA